MAKHIRKRDGSTTVIGRNGIEGNLPSDKAMGADNKENLRIANSTTSQHEEPVQMLLPGLDNMQKIVRDRMSSRLDPAITHFQQMMNHLRAMSADQHALANAVLTYYNSGPEEAGWIRRPSGIKVASWYTPETPSGYCAVEIDRDEETGREYVTSIHVTFTDPDDDDERRTIIYMDVNAEGQLHNEGTSYRGNLTVTGDREWYVEDKLVCRTQRTENEVKVTGPNGKRLPLLTEMRLTWILGFDLG